MGTTFLEDVRAYEPAKPTCTVGQALADMDDTLAEEVRAALNDPTLKGSAIARALTDRGWNIAPTTLARHRRGECRCD